MTPRMRISLPGLSLGGGRITVKESAIVIGLIVIFLFVSALIATRVTAPNVDEVMYTDPAMNLALGHGLRSTAWYTQARSEVWASNAPLHEFVMGAWLWVFGQSMFAARSFHFIFQASAAVVVWSAVGRLSLLRTRLSRLALVMLLLTGDGISICLHNGRPEGIKYLLAAFALYGFSIQVQRRRCSFLFVIGCISSLAGIQLIAYAGFFGAALYLFIDKPFRTAFIALGIGMGAGMVAMIGGFMAAGVGRRFLEATFLSGHMMTGRIAQSVVLHSGRFGHDFHQLISSISSYYLFDSSFVLLLALLIVALSIDFTTKRFRVSSLTFAGAIVGMTLPFVLSFIGKYGQIYAWMGFVPLAISSAALLDHGLPTLRALAAVVMLCASLMGLPTYMARAVIYWTDRDPVIAEQIVKQAVDPHEWAYVDDPAYFAAKLHVDETFSPTYAGGRGFREIPLVEREHISVMVMKPASIKLAQERLGGRWKEVARVNGPFRESNPFYDLVVLRRY